MSTAKAKPLALSERIERRIRHLSRTTAIVGIIDIEVGPLVTALEAVELHLMTIDAGIASGSYNAPYSDPILPRVSEAIRDAGGHSAVAMERAKGES